MKSVFTSVKRILLTVGMLACAVSAYSDFVISVYKEGGWSGQFNFHQASGSEFVCDNIVIDNYTGRTSDYKFWIGNGRWDDKSENVSLSNYLPSCDSGVFSAKIYNDSGDKNYYPHDFTCQSNDCAVQTKGSSIPANTVIF
ncbi:MAG: hypothetical protein IKS58_05880, partial [Paludibacteraceae bacterium]|nr:hypothetical protein [Paludibacteraceae bacterium]